MEQRPSISLTSRAVQFQGSTSRQRDFHEVEIGPETDPMAVEKILGQCEGKWSTVLRNVLEQLSLPNDDTFGDLMIEVDPIV
jgi:hypothetical protein